jgi:hypothetical protein
MSENFVSKAVDENGDGLDVQSCTGAKWREGTSGMVSDGSETFRLDNLESMVAGRACGAQDRSGNIN